jgi:DNA-binding CsgD family transcriptional regulator
LPSGEPAQLPHRAGANRRPPTSLALSTAEVTQLQAAVKTLLTPFDFDSVQAWRTESREAIAALVHADTAVSFLPLVGEAPYLATRQPDLTPYAEHFHALDRTPEYSRAIGSHAFTWRTMGPHYEQPDRASWLKSEFYNDWVRPQRLCQPCGLIVVRPRHELPAPVESWSGIAGLWFYWDKDERGAMGERELAILNVLLPAFEAGVHLLIRCAHERERVTRVLAGLGEGATLIDASGHVVYENPALRRILLQDTEARQIKLECARVGRLVLALASRRGVKSQAHEIVTPGDERVRTAGASYRVRGTLLGAGTLDRGPMALVVIERTAPEPLSIGELHDRYSLTRREVTVSQLLSQGRTNAQVSQVLGISIHTARRHAERVLLKLGVHTRAAVAGKLVRD